MARRRRLTHVQPSFVPSDAETGFAPTATGLPGPNVPAPTSVAPIAQVSGQSAEAAALREMAHGLQLAREEGRMILDVPLAEVSPGFLTRDRVVLDREELEALKSSMRSHGQRMPAEITKLEPETIDKLGTVYRYGLISGWRRLTALNELYAETGEARFSKIRALLRPKREAAESYVAMVEENEIRVGLSYFERARLISEITSQGVFPDQNTALRKLFASASRAKRSKIGSFVELADQLGDLLHFPSEISERLGLALVARLRQEGGCEALRAGLKQAQPENSAAEIALLEKLLQMSATKPANKPRIEHLGHEITLKTAYKNGRLTATFSGKGLTEDLLERLREICEQ